MKVASSQCADGWAILAPSATTDRAGLGDVRILIRARRTSASTPEVSEVPSDDVRAHRVSDPSLRWRSLYARADAVYRRAETRIPEEKCPERKTGARHAEVITARLIQDERGWLRLAG